MKILPVLQAGSTSVLGHMYDVDEEVLSPFQQAAEVVDPPGIPAARRRGVGGGGEILQGFAKPAQE